MNFLESYYTKHLYFFFLLNIAHGHSISAIFVNFDDEDDEGHPKLFYISPAMRFFMKPNLRFCLKSQVDKDF